MATTEHPPTPWSTRITWALVGASIAMFVMWLRGPGTVEPEPSPRAQLQPGAAVGGDAPIERSVAAVPVAAFPSDAATDVGSSTSPSGTTEHGQAEPTTGAATGSTTADPAPDTATDAPDDALAPKIPLPTMPGTRTMRTGQRRDEQTGDWIVTHALWVPAPGQQVESFYRSALQDAKMKVSGQGRPGSLGQGHRGTLRGRGRHANAQVTVQQRAGTLRTVVRIIWRLR